MEVPAKLAQLLEKLRAHGQVRREGGEWRSRCPAHADRNPSLFVRYVPESGNVLLRCSAGCRIEDVLSKLGLRLSDLFHDDELMVEIDDDLAPAANQPMDSTQGSSTTAPTAPDQPVDANVPIDLGIEDEVYSRLLALLSLSVKHRQDLRRRGLSDDQVDHFGYRTAEKFALRQAVGKLKQEFDDDVLLRVPGFRIERNGIRFVDLQGLLIPVRAPGSRIIALIVRRDDPAEGSKYVWVSSTGSGGASPGSPAHVPLGTPVQAQIVRLTEGQLKSDLGWALSGKSTIGVAGVANWRSAIPVLKTMQAGTVLLAFDADVWTKPVVAQNLIDCAEHLIRNGFEIQLERWDASIGKGIDDVLAAGHSPQLIASDQLQKVLGELRAVAVSRHYEDDDEADWVPQHPGDGVAPFPLDCLPPPIQQFATEAAAALQCPVDYVGLCCLTVASASVGNSRRIEIRPGYEEGCRIYGAIVGESGDGKSPAREAACEPIVKLQRAFCAQFIEARTQYQADLEQYELAKKASSKGGNNSPPPTKPEKPTLGHAFVESFTVEALSKIMTRQPRGMLLIRDELTGWVTSMNQYRSGKGDDREFFLSVWSGAAVKVDRVSDDAEPRIVFNPFLSILGSIPPRQLPVLDAGNSGEDGFLHRILFVYPKPVVNKHWDWAGLSSQTSKLWSDAISKLFQLDMVQDEHGQPSPRVLKLSPEARPVWSGWYDQHAAEAEQDDFDHMLKCFWPKCVAYAARLALILHSLRAACGEDVGDEIDAESLRRAITLVRYFQSHSRAVYSQLGLHRKSLPVQKAIVWIRHKGGECNPSQLVRNGVVGVKGKKAALELMGELADQGYGHLEDRVGKNNKKTTWFVAKKGK
jgi:hypothetical protein